LAWYPRVPSIENAGIQIGNGYADLFGLRGRQAFCAADVRPAAEQFGGEVQCDLGRRSRNRPGTEQICQIDRGHAQQGAETILTLPLVDLELRDGGFVLLEDARGLVQV